jgi:hypothetical protein
MLLRALEEKSFLRAGLGYATAQAIAGGRRKYSAVFGFESDADATKCATIIQRQRLLRRKDKPTCFC